MEKLLRLVTVRYQARQVCCIIISIIQQPSPQQNLYIFQYFRYLNGVETITCAALSPVEASTARQGWLLMKF
jgi:hypothetical protein